MNQCGFKHSARNLPLNDSMKGLSVACRVERCVIMKGINHAYFSRCARWRLNVRLARKRASLAIYEYAISAIAGCRKKTLCGLRGSSGDLLPPVATSREGHRSPRSDPVNPRWFIPLFSRLSNAEYFFWAPGHDIRHDLAKSFECVESIDCPVNSIRFQKYRQLQVEHKRIAFVDATFYTGISRTILNKSMRDSIEVVRMRDANRKGASATYSGIVK